MKKTLSIIFVAILMFSFTFAASAKIYTTPEAEEKREEFIYAEGSEVNGVIIDY